MKVTHRAGAAFPQLDAPFRLPYLRLMASRVTKVSKATKKTPRPSAQPPRIVVVVSTVGTEEQALDIAHHLVTNRLAVCVNILPGVRSVFRWKGKVNDDTEFLLIAKTIESQFKAVQQAMAELNAYELPEILGFPATFVDQAFGRWVSDCSTGRPDPEEPEEGDESGEGALRS